MDLTVSSKHCYNYYNALLLLLMFDVVVVPALCEPVAGKRSADDNDDDEQQQQQPVMLGELKDSRSARGRAKKYKCYSGHRSGGDDSEHQALGECTGRICIRIRHHQSGDVQFECKDFIEPSDPKPGQCKELAERQLPEQTETICACEGDFCNGAASSGAKLSLVLLLLCSLGAFLLCSSLVGAVILVR